MWNFSKFAAYALVVLSAQAWGQTPSASLLQGDVGAALYYTQPIVNSGASQTVALPYAYFDAGRFYTRVDTLGFKALPMGQGHLELAMRVSLEGFKTNQPQLAGLHERANPVPIGLGTYQLTPVGAFFLYSFYDTTSGGTLLDGMYAVEFKLGSVSFYPQLGWERRSARYVDHLYGVSAIEAAAQNRFGAYAASASQTPTLALEADVPLGGDWHANLQWRRRWLDSAITQSPLVQGKMQDSGFVALTRNFQ